MKFIVFLLLAATPWAVLFAEDSGSTPEIVVTATKEPTDERVLTVPVTVIDPATSDATDLGGLLANAPGVNVQTATPGQPSLAAEAYGTNSFGEVNFLLDGVSLNRPDMNATSLGVVPLLAVDHVEFLNGPGSALYGDQSIAGAVNVVTKVPTKATASVVASGDQNGGSDVSALFGVPSPLGGGFLFSVDHDHTIPTRSGSTSTLDYWTVWSKATVGPVAKQTLTLSDFFTTGKSPLPGSLTAAEVAQNPNQVEASQSTYYSTTTMAQVASHWDYATDGFSATVPVSYQYRDINAFYSSGTDYKLNQLETEPTARRTFSEDGGASLTVALAAGGSYQQLDVSVYQDLAETNLTVGATLRRYNGHTWASVQQDWGSYVATGVVRAELSATQASSAQQSSINNQQMFPAITYTVGTAWLPNEASKVAVNVGSVFRYPMTDEMVSYYYSPFGFNTGLKPETGTTGELSGETSWSVVKLAVRGSVTALTNEIGYNGSSNVNLDPTIHWIGDVDLSTQPITLENVPGTSTAGAEYTYTKALFTWGGFQGDQLPLVSNHKVRFSLGYQPVTFLQLSGHETLTSGFYMDTDFANVYGQLPWRDVIDADVSLQWPGSSWSFTVYGHNLLNDQTSDYATEYQGAGSYYPANGRTFGGVVKAVY